LAAKDCVSAGCNAQESGFEVGKGRIGFVLLRGKRAETGSSGSLKESLAVWRNRKREWVKGNWIFLGWWGGKDFFKKFGPLIDIPGYRYLADIYLTISMVLTGNAEI
jgi:hypothetical protein